MASRTTPRDLNSAGSLDLWPCESECTSKLQPEVVQLKVAGAKLRTTEKVIKYLEGVSKVYPQMLELNMYSGFIILFVVVVSFYFVTFYIVWLSHFFNATCLLIRSH